MAQTPSRSVGSVREVRPLASAPDVVWVSVSPSLRAFDQPLLRYLSQQRTVAQWEYGQSWDEPSSLEQAADLLQDYLNSLEQPVHLVGHGLGGVLALICAQQGRPAVRSLSLLAVAAQPAATWHAHYYVQRHLLTVFSRQQLLAHLSRSLFGGFAPYPVGTLIKALARDLDLAPTNHSLYQISRLPQADVPCPLLVCGSETDPIVSPASLLEWERFLKPQDHCWMCEDGRHFFQFAYPALVGDRLQQFWQSLPQDLPAPSGTPQIAPGARTESPSPRA